MKLSEIKEKILNSSFSINDLKIETYLKMLYKKVAISKIVNECITYENNIAIVDYILKRMSINLSLLINYCDIEVDEELSTDERIDIYDLLEQYNVFESIKEKIGSDAVIFCEAVNNEINNIITKNNTIESVIANGLNKLIDKLPSDKDLLKLAKELPKQVNKLNPDKLKFISQALDKFNGKW